MGGPDRTNASRAAGRTPPALLDEDDPALFPKLTDKQLMFKEVGYSRAILFSSTPL
jgi:hypothetical protein